jgi:hypothetical protein
MRPAFLLASLLLGAAVCSAQPDAFPHAKQMLVVTTSGWDATSGWLRAYSRDSSREPWRQVGEPTPIVVGKNGMAWGLGLTVANPQSLRGPGDPVKKEGDRRAPAGAFSLGSAFGVAAERIPGTKLPYLHLSSSIECVDDANSRYYNQLMDRSAVTPDWRSSEHMRSVGESYRWGIVVGQNGAADIAKTPPVRNGGSCVFLHVWGGAGEGTAGCTAMPRSALEGLLVWIDPALHPVLVQMPEAEYLRFAPVWGLPAVHFQQSR